MRDSSWIESVLNWMDGVGNSGWFALFLVTLFAGVVVVSFMLGYETGKEDGTIDERKRLYALAKKNQSSGVKKVGNPKGRP